MRISKVVTSDDNTKKYYFVIPGTNDLCVEACLLHLDRYGYIVCVSSQIGCPQKCKFCAAGYGKFIRNLTSLEIQEQVQGIVDDNPQMMNENFQVTYMGSGEPLCNYRNVFDSIDSLRALYSNLSKVNLSTTCPEMARQCFEEIQWEKYQDFLHLQYSLHFTTDDQREEYLSPKLLKISDAIEELNWISTLLNDTYKVNYVLIDNVNDFSECVFELQRILDRTRGAIMKISQMCKVNNSKLLPSRKFEEFVTNAEHVINKVEVFRSDGTDVNAGCGQFYNESVI